MKRSTWTLLLTALAALSITPAAWGKQGAVASRASADDAAATRDYWTLKRMRDAVPLDLPSGPGLEREPFASSSAIPPDQEIPAELDTTYPYRIHGRLFLRFNGEPNSCSATVVTSFSRDLILTAGHCVNVPRGGGQVNWATDLLFVPGYRNGVSPLGEYPAVNAGTPSLWAVAGVISFDLGIVKLAAAGGIAIQDLLGSRGVSFNRSAKSFKGQTVQAFGYPAAPNPGYNGERPILCNSPILGFDGFSGSPVIGPCHQQQGASGGGWVQNGGIVTSLTSHAACRNPTPSCTLVAGTYLGNAAFKLYSAIGGGLPKKLKKRLRGCKRKRGKKRQRCLNRFQTFQPVIR
jgi:V8-like Glu-specific endopeptidase